MKKKKKEKFMRCEKCSGIHNWPEFHEANLCQKKPRKSKR